MTLNPSRFNLRDYFLGSERLPKIGNNVAIEYGGERITYDALGKLVRYYGDQLRGQGIAEGDRVALLLYDSPLFISYFLAANQLRMMRSASLCFTAAVNCKSRELLRATV